MRPLGCLTASSVIVDRLPQQPCRRRRVEVVLDRVAVGGLPRARPEHRPEHGADAGLGIVLGPVVARASPRSQIVVTPLFRSSETATRRRRASAYVGPDAEDRHELVERALAELSASRTPPACPSSPAREPGWLWMLTKPGISIKPWPSSRADRAGVARPDMDHLVARERQVRRPVEIDVVLASVVPSHDPVAAAADVGRWHRSWSSSGQRRRRCRSCSSPPRRESRGRPMTHALVPSPSLSASGCVGTHCRRDAGPSALRARCRGPCRGRQP